MKLTCVIMIGIVVSVVAWTATDTGETKQVGDETLLFLLENAELVVVGNIDAHITTSQTHTMPGSEAYIRISIFELNVVEVLVGDVGEQQKLNVAIWEYAISDDDETSWLKPGGRYVLFLKRNKYVALRDRGRVWDTSDIWCGIQPFRPVLADALKRLGKKGPKSS